MPAIGYIVEQALFGSITLSLFIAYALQLKQDYDIGQLVQMQQDGSVVRIVFTKTYSVGNTAMIFHIGGVIGCLINVIRSIDPFPVLGLLPYLATDLLSHIGIAVLLITLFEGLGSLVSKTYNKLSLPVSGNFLMRGIRIINYLTMFVAIITWIIENFVSPILAYSAGAYFIYGTLAQWTIWIMFSLMVNMFIKTAQRTTDQVIKQSIKKLRWIQFIFFLIIFVLTIYQIYVFADQVENKSRIVPIDGENYSPIQAPLYVTQIVSFAVMLWVSYIKPKLAGNVKGLSEVTENTTNEGTNRGLITGLPTIPEANNPTLAAVLHIAVLPAEEPEGSEADY